MPSWSVGWCLGEAEAIGKGTGRGSVLCLNPVDAKGRLKWRTGERGPLKKLLALAKHEAAHIREPYHDESFATLLTDLDAEIDEATVLAPMWRAR